MSTWRSLLCQHDWIHPFQNGNRIVFHEDGAGELHCGVAPATLICAVFSWKPVDDTSAKALQQPVIPEESATEHIHALIEVRIELTLHKQLPAHAVASTVPDLNDTNLAAAAFQPKNYTLRLAAGKFTADKWAVFKDSLDSTEGDSAFEGIDTCYKHQLLFDISPYPPLEEWVERNNSVNRAIKLHEFWKLKDFYSNSSET